MSETTYQCFACRKTFISGWSDEEAQRELRENFPGYDPKDEMCMLCDDCYNEIMSR